MAPEQAMFHTATMAKILADQNRLEDAARVYRNVLKSDPHNEQLRRALQSVEQKLKQRGPERIRELARKWVDLLVTCQRLNHLEKSRQRIAR